MTTTPAQPEPSEREILDQPDGIQAEHLDDFRIPAPAAAAERVVEFVKWFGDGIVRQDSADEPPLYARDLCALACAVLHGYQADAPSRCLHEPVAARPTPVVSADAVERAAREAWRMTVATGDEDVVWRAVAAAVLAALGLTVADTPAADDEGGQGR